MVFIVTIPRRNTCRWDRHDDALKRSGQRLRWLADAVRVRIQIPVQVRENQPHG
mgnify:CR=1 FL=1